jgi:dTDP-glucose 4,6-dehydratase
MKPLDSVDLEYVLGHTLPLWERARGKHFFMSGATGFFGAWLLESFVYCNRRLGLEARASVLSRNPAAFAQKMPHLADESCIRLVQGDVRDFSFPAEGVEYIVHAAAPTSGEAARRPLDLLSTILNGAERMLDFAKERRARRFLFTSSGAVYGRQPENISHLPEDYLGGPDWLDANAAYAEGKRVAEQMCALYAQETGIEVAIARCFAFVGAHLPLNQHFAIGNFIADALAGRKITIRGDGTPMRSYLYGADLAIWLWTMLLCEAPSGSNPLVLNVGSGEAISILDLAQVVVGELDPKLEIEVMSKPIAGAALAQYVPDVRKAETSLGLRTTIPLREAIRRTAMWNREP